eukprot:gene23042-27627_t
MSRAIHVFRTPDRFVAGTVGEPGDRSFYLQAVHESRVVSVLLEKQQVQVLADRMGLLLEEVHRRFGTEVPPQADDVSDLSPLVTPLDAEFRVGTMGLGWDADAGAVVVELLAVSETEFDESVVLDDADDGPDAVRVFLTPEQAREFSLRGTSASAPMGTDAASPSVSRSTTQTTTRSDVVSEPGVPDVLLEGDLTLIGQITTASNATLVCESTLGEKSTRVVYKPVRGERPLWDFPDGTLAGREVASYRVSEALGWGVIPRTVLRDGPFGPGMVQRWIDTVDRRADGSGGLEMVDLCSPGNVPPGWFEVLQAFDSEGEP